MPIASSNYVVGRRSRGHLDNAGLRREESLSRKSVVSKQKAKSKEAKSNMWTIDWSAPDGPSLQTDTDDDLTSQSSTRIDESMSTRGSIRQFEGISKRSFTRQDEVALKRGSGRYDDATSKRSSARQDEGASKRGSGKQDDGASKRSRSINRNNNNNRALGLVRTALILVSYKPADWFQLIQEIIC